MQGPNFSFSDVPLWLAIAYEDIHHRDAENTEDAQS